MPTLREECLLGHEADIEVWVSMTEHQQVEDIYNEYLESLYDAEVNFWTINHDEDEISQEDFMSLIQICAQTNLYPLGWRDTGGPGASHGHMDRMLKHYYAHMCIQEKDWICEKIQSHLNAE